MPDNEDNKSKQEYLKDIILETLTSDDLEAAIRNIAMELGKLFNADRVHFRFYDEEMKVFSEVIEEYRKTEEIPSSKGKMIYPADFDSFLKDKLYKTRHFYIIDDINAPEYPENFRQLFSSLNINNEIILANFYKDKLESAFFITNTESKELMSEKNLKFLIPVAKQLSIGTHLFKVQNSLVKTVSYEKILREIIMEVKGYDDQEKVFEFLVNKLTDIYKVNRVSHLRPNEKGDFWVIYEAIKDPLENLTGRSLISAQGFNKLTTYMEDSIIVINNIVQIPESKLKKCLRDNKIEALMLYPLEEQLPMTGATRLKDRIMVCSSVSRKWSREDIEALKLIVGTITIIYVDISKRSELKDIEKTFTASLVHDLKSPILAQQRAIEFLTKYKKEQTIQNCNSYLMDIYTTNEEILKLVNNLLDVYKLEMGGLHVNKEPTNIKKLAESAIKDIHPLAEEKEITINKNITEEVGVIEIDPDETKRVFLNLLSNAIKHNPKKITVNVSISKKDNEILIEISDNGVGIAEAEKPKIFRKFYTKKGKVGTGLGLYLSKQIVEFHDGKIWFESEEGKGTTFYFTLPLENMQKEET